MLRYLPYGRYDKGVSAVAVGQAYVSARESRRCSERCITGRTRRFAPTLTLMHAIARSNNTAFAINIKLEQKDLSPPLFIEEVSRSDGGVFKGVPMGIAEGRKRLK